MDQKEIKFDSVSTSPSEYQCNDGELERSVNLINEGGQFKSTIIPTPVLSLDDGYKLMCIHKSSEFYHYIITNGTVLKALKKEDKTISEIIIGNISNIRSVTPIGNTLVILSDFIHYALYTQEKYISLGAKPPFPSISFGLQGNFVSTKNQFTYSGSKPNNYFGDYQELGISSFTTEGKDDDYMESEFTNNLLAQVNKFISEEATEKNKFIMPFFIRYAYRLYDGTLFMHSVPILMTPMSGVAPVAYISKEVTDDKSGNNYTQEIYSRVCAMACDIDYVIDGIYINHARMTTDNLTKWKDIIKSIDIYVSAPMYVYDQSGKVKGWTSIYDRDGGRPLETRHTVSKLNTWNSYSDISDKDDYKRRNFCDLYVRGNLDYTDITTRLNPIYSDTKRCPVLMWDLPKKTDEEISKEFRDASLFYKVASIPIEGFKITGTRKILKLDDKALKNIRAKESMDDGYLDHNLINAKSAFSYNSRLNISNIDMFLSSGTPTNSQIAYTSGSGIVNTELYTYIKSDNQESIVKNVIGKTSYIPRYLFFQDNGAYKIRLVQGNSYLDYPLNSHPLINGASFFNGFEVGDMQTLPEVMNAVFQPKVSYPNKLYTSKVNNPFVFPSSGINTIGTGSIIAISSSTKALSQGQFGQFPLYAFSSDGVWAMEVSSTGGYSTKQPATRDVLLDEKSLTQVDGYLFFATKQGIMLLDGSSSYSISDLISERKELVRLINLDQFFSAKQLSGYDFDIIPFKDYVQGSLMSYDYPNKQLIVFNPSYNYSYIYSIDYKKWGMLSKKYIDVCNDYPTSLIVDESNIVYDSSKDAIDLPRLPGVIITRSIKFDSPDILKSVRSLILRGVFDKGDVSIVLYASMDNQTFHPIASSIDNEIRGLSGSPFKYYKLVIYTNLQIGESLYGASFMIETKRTNKLR